MLNLEGVKIIAVDFDGTLFEEDYPRIGKPIYPMINYIKLLKEKGIQIILYTLRTGQLLEDAIEACRNVGLEFDAVNENMKWRIDLYGGDDPRKVGAEYYIDDRAVNANQLLSELVVHPCYPCMSSKCPDKCERLTLYKEINKDF